MLTRTIVWHRLSDPLPISELRPLINPAIHNRTCKIGNNTLIGSHTVISANASVHASVIGQRCTIGPGAVLREAYVFDDTHIGAGAVVEGSIIGARVTLGDGARIPRGCLIANSIVIRVDAKLRKFERVSKKREERPSREEDGSNGDNEESDSELEEVEARMSTSAACFTTGDADCVFHRPRGCCSNSREGFKRARLATSFTR